MIFLKAKKNQYYYWGGICVFTLGIAYSFDIFISPFLYLSITEKVIAFMGSFIFLLSIFLLSTSHILINEVNDEIRNFSKVRWRFLIGAAILLSILSFLITVKSVPTNNRFEIVILPSDNSQQNIERQIDILEINKLPRNGEKGDLIAPSNVVLTGDWTINKTSFSYSHPEDGSIVYSDYSTNGISLLLINGPGCGKIQIIWNGISQIIDLEGDVYDQFTINFPRKFSWNNLSNSQKVFVGLILPGNFLSILFFLILLLDLKKKYLNIWAAFSQNPLMVNLLLISIPIIIFINIFSFFQFQENDIERIERVKSTTLVDLDNSSTDNFPNFQVYFKISRYYNNSNLILPKNYAESVRLEIQKLVYLGQLKEVKENNYHPELTEDQWIQINSQIADEVLPLARVRYKYAFLIDDQVKGNEICVWSYKDTTLFVPIRKDLDCSDENK